MSQSSLNQDGNAKVALGHHWLKYLRFGAMNALVAATTVSLALGGAWMWTGFVGIVLITTIVDELRGDEEAAPVSDRRWLFDGMLYLTLPLLVVMSVLYCFFLSGYDPIALSAIGHAVGLDLASNRAATNWWHLLGGAMSVGICYGTAGINVAHELIHRTDRPFDRVFGRWLLAFNLDTTFMIEHIEGHHRNAATEYDPATARRGQYIFAFVVTSTIGGFLHAFSLERSRLAGMGRSPWSLANRAARGQFISLFYMLVFYWLAGWVGVAAFIFTAINGKVYLELVNFIEHYGLVRVPGTPVSARHSWDSHRTLSSAILYNLTHHSDHHVNARKPYYARGQGAGRAPVMPMGYGTMIALAIFRPIFWRRKVHRALADWDANLASDGERELIAERNWTISGTP